MTLPGPLGRVSWSLADQVLASGTNFALTVVVARAVAPASFGVFAVTIATYTLISYVVRGLCADPLVTRYSATTGWRWAQAADGSVAAAVGCGTGLAVLLAGVSAVLPADLGHPFLALAVVVPGVVLQDHLRFVFFTGGRPRAAFANDLGWALVQIGGTAAVLARGAGSISALVLVWGASGTAAGLVGLVQLGRRPAPRRLWTWVVEQRDLWRFYVAENLVLQGANLVVLGVVGAVAGLAASGSIRAGATLFAPLSVLGLGALAGVAPELRRVAERDVDRMRRLALGLGVGLGVVTALWGGLALAVPDEVGRAVFGETWALARPILGFVLVDAVASLFVLGPFAGLRVLGRGRRSLVLRSGFAVVRLGVACLGALLAGAVGAVAGFALVAPLQIALWWWFFDREAKRGLAPPPPVDAVDGTDDDPGGPQPVSGRLRSGVPRRAARRPRRAAPSGARAARRTARR